MKCIALLCLLAIGCHRADPMSTTTTGHPHVFGDLQSQLTLQQGAMVGVPAAGYKTLFFDTSGNFTQMDSTGARSAIGGGSSFGTPLSISQNNDAGTPVTTMTYTNTFTVKTPGAETSGNVFGAKLDGGTINTDISFLNEQAPQLVTTSIAQPSIAWNPRTDVLDVTVGATTLTKLTITGCSMDADRLIAVEWVTANGGEAATITTQSFVRL